MALIRLQIPCSGAEVERVFARLRRLLGDHVRHWRADLVEARENIVVNSLDVTHEFMSAVSEMELEVLGAPARD
jgi:hypothetical protein